ncbi:MYXO-CTERM sorting domain-containing protein [Anaeromyxobacter sp. Fw109-5]|uniref:MYXO-CTERM sorting domain-containing protein n=1 Tax=Anaeromyxobacter sp. (strain Fw109-5) TaxID=404589 RepID=UPI0000ED7FD6|nr:MYXO-CTERM sorting domain-containing protein [Anaeromyxobacter sp. Fw109-5]ABS25474.1 peptidase M10A and M12B matrixin and adamalysin [Anaeromyxobacter sp. Fw109-5]
MSGRTSRVAAAVAAVLVAFAAQAYERTKSSQGACFYWPQRTVPFWINANRSASSASCAAPSGAETVAIEAARASFRTWTGAAQSCTDLVLEDRGLSASSIVGFDQRSGATNQNLVVFRDGWCSNEFSDTDPCWDVDPFTSPSAIEETCANLRNCFEDPSPLDRATIAITTVTHDPRSGQIRDADIELADWTGLRDGQSLGSTQPPEGWYFTCGTYPSPCGTYGQDSCSYIDLQSNVTHEVGHFIGLAHPCELGDGDCGQNSPFRDFVMFPSASLADFDKRVLHPDDLAGLCAIYPTGKAPVTCGSSGGGGGGCASAGGGAGILSAALALAALAWRRRQR